MALVGRRAVALAEDVRAGRVSARQVVEEHLDHLEAVEAHLGAFVAVRREAALREADAVDLREDRFALPLAGVPVAVKDIVDVRGEATRHGSAATSPEPVSRDHAVVTRLREAGAVVIGKTRCPELALWGTSDDPGGIAVSPWDPTRTAGGSSGGSAAAVAAGVVPIALASDGMGSVRIPAGATGTVGLKPGAGRLPVIVDGEHHWYGMSRFGPIATCVDDLALALDVMDGVTEHREPPAEQPRLRVAVSWTAPLAGMPVGRPWQEAAVEAGRVLRHLGHQIAHADPPYDQAAGNAAVARYLQGPAQDVAAMGLDVERLQRRTRGHLAAGERMAAGMPVEPEQAERWRERLEPFLSEHDVLVTPMFARTPPRAVRWHERSWQANIAANSTAYPFTGVWNLADVPAASVPLGVHHGRPTAVQVVARAGREDLVLSVARELEATAGWHRHAPGWHVPSSD